MQTHNKRQPVREKVKPNIWRRRNKTGAWTYEIVFRDSRNHVTRKKVDGGLKAAERELRAVQTRKDTGQRVSANTRLTFAQAAQEYMDVKASTLKPKTIASYRWPLDIHLLPEFGSQRLDRIDVVDAARFVARMGTAAYRREIEARCGKTVDATEGYAVETIKSALIPMSRTFDYAKRYMTFGGENVVRALDKDERPGYGKHKRKKRKLGRDELDRLIASATSPWRELIATGAALGTRVGETLGLMWCDVDFESGVITIARQANAKRELVSVKSDTAQRTIEAPGWLLTMLREQKLRSRFSGESDLVFVTATGKPHSQSNVLARGLYPASDRAGLPRVSFHSLRHTHASLWIKDGGDVITLSKRLGHANPQITMSHYADEIQEAQDRTARQARVDAMYGDTKMATLLAATEGDKPHRRKPEIKRKCCPSSQATTYRNRRLLPLANHQVAVKGPLRRALRSAHQGAAQTA